MTAAAVGPVGACTLRSHALQAFSVAAAIQAETSGCTDGLISSPTVTGASHLLHSRVLLLLLFVLLRQVLLPVPSCQWRIQGYFVIAFLHAAVRAAAGAAVGCSGSSPFT